MSYKNVWEWFISIIRKNNLENVILLKAYYTEPKN